MVLLGLLLFAASVAAASSIAISNTDAAAFEVFGETVTDLTPGGLLLLGVGLGVAGLLGLWMISAGLRRMRHRREEGRSVALETRSRVEELEEENVRLRAVNARRQTTTGVAPTAMPTTSAEGSTSGFGTATDRDRDRDWVAGADHHPTPMMATAPEPIDLREGDATDVYPPDTAYAAPGSDQDAAASASASADTSTPQEGRVFGRRNR